MLLFGLAYSRSGGADIWRLLGAIAIAATMIVLSVSPVWGDWSDKDKHKKSKLSKSAAEAQVIALIEQARSVESIGDITRRKDLLDQAAEIAETTNPTLNSLRGLVLHGNQWHRPEAISLDPKFKATLDEYRKLRDGSPDTVQTWLELAQWCRSKGLTSEFRANLKRVLEAP